MRGKLALSRKLNISGLGLYLDKSLSLPLKIQQRDNGYLFYLRNFELYQEIVFAFEPFFKINSLIDEFHK